MSPDEPYFGAPLKVGPYWVEERLGRGGMGEVYRGFDERLERPVALKHVRAELTAGSSALRRFRREAKAIARLNHPAIVQIHDWVETDDGCWYVMELVEGRTLRSVIGGKPLPADQVIAIGSAVAGALAAAHDAGIVHRDLKADNVMIAASGKVKLLDFGLAKRARPEDDEMTLTGEQKIVGTITAMSPEQAQGLPVDARSDLFSFGSLLYEAATGASPFRRDNATQTLTWICTKAHEPATLRNPRVPPALSELIDDLLEKEPGRRPRSAHDVLARLERIGAGDASLAENATVAALQRPAATERDAAQASRDTGISSLRTSERRQVTVLAAGVLGARGEPLDSEALFEVLPQLESLAADLAARWESHLEEIHGHRLVMCFGYPTAHEDETRRAVLAALELVEGVERLGRDLGQPLAARAALATGLAVAATQDRGERLVLGGILDLALGLQDSAAPGDVVLGAATHGLVGRFFECSEEAPIRLSGTAEPQAVHRVVAVRDDASAPRDLELVARREELELLLGRWRLARSGEGQVVLLTGAAGIGKSRLVRELTVRLETEGAATWTLYGSPDAGRTPLYPVLRALRRRLELDTDGDAPDAGLARLEAFLDRLELERDEHVPYLAALLALPLGGRYKPPDLGPRRLQETMQHVVLSLLLASAEERPMALVVEDLHWLDPSTLELVRLLIEDVATVPLLAVLTARPELEVPWRQQARLTQLALGRLEDSDAARLIEQVGGAAMAPEVRDLIAAKTDGVPLFAEELTKALLESGELAERDGRLELAVPAERLALPATLRDSLAARLDRVGPARAVAQTAAVLGRSFRFEQLAAVVEREGGELEGGELEGGELERLLDDLARAELVLRRGYGSRRRYAFKHALIRDAAYDSLLAGERRRLHGRIADVLEKSPEVRDRHPERLARHLTEAGLGARAAAWWLAAGEQAISRSAHREGAEHSESGLALAGELPPGAERTALELKLATQLAAAYAVLEGYASPRVERCWSRARELCGELDDDPRLFWLLWGLWAFHLVRSDLDVALDLGARLLAIAEAADDADLTLVALGAVGQARYFRGDLEPARRHLDRAAALDDPGRDTPVASVSGQDVGVVAFAARALVLWHLGEDENAVASSDAAVELAKRLDHSYSLAFARVFAARLHQSRGDSEALERHARAVVALSEEKGYFWLAQGTFFLGCRRAGDGAKDAAEALRLMTTGLDAYRAAGARLSLTYMLAQLAEAHLAAGDREQAARRLAEAEAQLEASAERFWQSELLRLQAELAGDPDAARAARERALELARSSCDRALERRAARALES